MKICYLINSNRVGGAEQHAYDLARGMVLKGHQVWMIMPKKKFKVPAEGEARQGRQSLRFKVIEESHDDDMGSRYVDAGVIVIRDSPRFDLDPFFIFRTAKFLKKEKIEIVHTHQLKTTVNGILAAFFAGVPQRVAHIHDTILQWEIPWYKKFIDVFVNTLVCNLFATDVIALTPQVKEWLVAGEKIRSEKVRVIPNGIDVERFKNPSGTKSFFLRRRLGFLNGMILVGSIGRLTVEKGHIYLVEAIPEIIANCKLQIANLHFVLVGEGERRLSLERRIEELGIGNCVTLLGFQPEEDKPKILWDLDIFVFPSIREGFGIAMLEAMAVGLPVVASDLPKALREIASELEVLFFEPGSPKALASQVVELLEDETLRVTLGQNAQKKAQEFSLERFWDDYGRLYSAKI